MDTGEGGRRPWLRLGAVVGQGVRKCVRGVDAWRARLGWLAGGAVVAWGEAQARQAGAWGWVGSETRRSKRSGHIGQVGPAAPPVVVGRPAAPKPSHAREAERQPPGAVGACLAYPPHTLPGGARPAGPLFGAAAGGLRHELPGEAQGAGTVGGAQPAGCACLGLSAARLCLACRRPPPHPSPLPNAPTPWMPPCHTCAPPTHPPSPPTPGRQFCHTGRMGLLGNLSAAQIVEQVVEARRFLAQEGAPGPEEGPGPGPGPETPLVPP